MEDDGVRGESVEERLKQLEGQPAGHTEEAQFVRATALASCHLFTDDVVKALDALQSTRRADAVSHQWYHSAKLYVEGMCLLRKRQPAGAKAKFSEIQLRDPHFILYHLGLAAVQMERREFRSAFGHYKAVLAGLGTYAPPITRVGLGLCSFHLGRIDHARQCLERALEIDPSDELGLRILFVVCLKQRDLDRLATCVVRLVELSPADPVVLLRFVDVLFYKADALGPAAVEQRRDELLSFIQRGEELAQSEQPPRTTLVAYAKFQRGRLQQVAGDWAGAKASFEEALKANKSLLPARIGLARALHHMGREAECFELLRKVEGEVHDDVEVLGMLISLYSQHGQHEQAERLGTRIVNTDAAAAAATWYLIGYSSRLDRTLADKFLRNGARLDTEEGNPASWRLKGELAAMNDEINGVADAVSEALGTNDVRDIVKRPNVALEHVPLVLAYAHLLVLSRPADARLLAIHVLRHHPGLPDSIYLLYTIATEQNRPREAIAWLNLLGSIDRSNDFATVSVATMYLRSNSKEVGRRAYNVLQQNAERRAQLLPLITRGAIYLREAQRVGQQHQLVNALTRFKAALKVDPGNLLAAHGITCCVALQGDANGAAGMLQRVMEVPANDPRVQRGAQTHQIMSQVKSGNYRYGLNLASKSSEPTTSRHKSTLAFAHLCQGDFDAARRLIEQALQQAVADNVDPSVAAGLRYNKAIILTSMAVAQLLPGHGLSEAEGEALRATINDARDAAAAARSQRYKVDAAHATQFMTDLLHRLSVLEKERLRQLRRGDVQRRQSLTLDSEWQLSATQAKAEREATQRELLERRAEVERLQAERSRAQLELVNELVNSWTDLRQPAAAEEPERPSKRPRDEADGRDEEGELEVDQGAEDEMLQLEALGDENAHAMGETLNVNLSVEEPLLASQLP